MRLFKNGTIASEETPELQKADILVDDEGVIHQIAETIEAVDGSTTVSYTHLTLPTIAGG